MSSTCRVAPFGYLRIKTCLQFPEAFRSLPRPSSPPEAKASTVRSCNLLSVVLIESQELFVLFYTCSHLLVALKLQSTTITIDSLSFYSLQTNLISSFNFTSLSFLKLVNELTVISQTGCKDTHFFFTSKLFCTFFNIFHNLYQPPPILVSRNFTNFVIPREIKDNI